MGVRLSLHYSGKAVFSFWFLVLGYGEGQFLVMGF